MASAGLRDRSTPAHRAHWLLGVPLLVCAVFAVSAGVGGVAQTGDRTGARAGTVSAPSEAHIYRRIDGRDAADEFRWTLAGSDPVTIASDSEDEQFLNICRSDGSTLRWEVEQKEGAIRAHREKDAIVFSGRWEGETVNRRVAIDRSPWYQALSYSLRQQLAADGLPLTFWMVRPDTLEPVRLRAERDGREELALADRKVPCVRIRVTGTGFTARFWHCFYWFREADGLFMRYEGLFGVPGLPKTLIEWRAETPAGGDGPG